MISQLIWVDWLILVIVLASMLVSLWRGLVQEALSLASWFFSYFIAVFFTNELAGLMVSLIESTVGRKIIAFATMFIITKLLFALLAHLLSEMINFVGLTNLDRLLGMVYGFLRAVFILLTLIVLMKPVLPLEQEAWWQQSALIPELMMLEDWFLELVAWLKGQASIIL